MMASEEVTEPGDLLVERSSERGQGEPEELRVTTDGDVVERTSIHTWFDGTDWHFDPQPHVWRRLVRLDPGELDALRAAIASSGFLDAPPERRPQGTSIGGTNVTWTATHDGRRHTVRLLGVPDVHDPAVDALDRSLQEIVTTAMQRES
jgi:hypothetical protein